MKKVMILLALLAVTIMARADYEEFADRPLDVSCYPQVVAEETKHDFGTIAATDGSVTHRFVVTNVGEQPLLIVSGKASCVCMRLRYTITPIEPGEHGTVEVTFEPTGKSGNVSQWATVTTNAYNRATNACNKQLNFTITAWVEP